jgi:DUF1365 family protein
VRHAFGYGLFMAYLDLAELDEVFAGRWLWSTSRPALARFRRGDHLGDGGAPLDAAVRSLVEGETGERPAGPIRLLTQLAYLGYCFNPVSFYYCFDAAGERVVTIVAEVNNTPWGERHCYVLDARGGAGLAFAPRKALHVSPFMPMDVRAGGAAGVRRDARSAPARDRRRRARACVASLPAPDRRRDRGDSLAGTQALAQRFTGARPSRETRVP